MAAGSRARARRTPRRRRSRGGSSPVELRQRRNRAADPNRRLADEQAQLVRRRRAPGIETRDQLRRQAVESPEDKQPTARFGGAEQEPAQPPEETLPPPPTEKTP